MQKIAPSAEDIRRALVSRAEAFSDKHKVTFSFISLSAVNDSKFLAEVRNGRNFTVGLYQRVIDWMDEQERRAA